MKGHARFPSNCCPVPCVNSEDRPLFLFLATNGKLGTLTDREREVDCLIAEDKSTKEIAVKLGHSIKTIETHRANVFAKLQVHSVAELVHTLRAGLVKF